MSLESVLITLAPAIVRLLERSAMAAARGDHATAARLAEEAGRKQAVRLAADAALKAKKKAAKKL